MNQNTPLDGTLEKDFWHREVIQVVVYHTTSNFLKCLTINFKQLNYRIVFSYSSYQPHEDIISINQKKNILTPYFN